MSKRQILMILGVLVMVLLYLGFPTGWDKILMIILGAFIAIVAYRLRPEGQSNSGEKKDMPFVEHRDDQI